MAATNYYTIQGEVIAERTGSSRRELIGDPLGSIGHTVSGGAVENRYFYKPYGALLSRSGPGQDPKLKWVGAFGQSTSDRRFAEIYARMRTYSTEASRWTSLDPLWPEEHPYAYADGQPITLIDPFGLASAIAPLGGGDGCYRRELKISASCYIWYGPYYEDLPMVAGKRHRKITRYEKPVPFGGQVLRWDTCDHCGGREKQVCYSRITQEWIGSGTEIWVTALLGTPKIDNECGIFYDLLGDLLSANLGGKLLRGIWSFLHMSASTARKHYKNCEGSITIWHKGFTCEPLPPGPPNKGVPFDPTRKA